MQNSCHEIEADCSPEHRCVICLQYDAAIDRVRQLKAALLEANHEAARLGTLKNNVHESTSRIPKEVLSRIMEVFYEEDSDIVGQQTKIFPPFKFGAVSRTWRQIAWSTPRMWSVVHFSLDSMDQENRETIALRIELCKQYVSRSGSLPLTIEVQCRDYSWQFDSDVEKKDIVDMLLSWASRWHTVSLEFTADMYAYMNKRLPDSCSPNFEVLYMSDIDPSNDFSPSMVPMNWESITGGLKKIVLWGFALRHLTVNTTHLEEIEGQSSVASLSYYIRTSPKLQTAKFKLKVGGLDGDNERLFGECFVHERIQHLHLDSLYGTHGESILGNLVCPNLKSFGLNGSFLKTHSNNIGHFVSSSPNLRSLTLIGFESTVFDVPSLPQLEELTISRPTYNSMSHLIETAFNDYTSTLGKLLSCSLQRLQFDSLSLRRQDLITWDFLLAIDATLTHPTRNGNDPLLRRLRERRLEVVIIVYKWYNPLQKGLQSSHRQAIRRMKSAGIDISMSMETLRGRVDLLALPDDWISEE